jgi:hypothetical protein
MKKKQIEILFKEAEKDMWCGECGLEHILRALVKISKESNVTVPKWANEAWCLKKDYKPDEPNP